FSVNLNVVVRAGDAATLDQLEADDRAVDAFLALGEQRVAPDEIALLQLHDPAQPGLQRVDRLGDLIAIEWHARFQPQRIACTEADGLDAVLGARLHDRVPQLDDALDRAIELPAILTGVARSRCQAGHSGNLGIDGRKRLHGAKVDR